MKQGGIPLFLLLTVRGYSELFVKSYAKNEIILVYSKIL